MGDTLRFREVTSGRMSVAAPQGTVEMQTSQQALIALTFAGGDTAHTWFERLSIGVEANGQSIEPPTDALLELPYDLRFDERGRVETIRSPRFPPEFAQVGDLARKFDDFFLRLPLQSLRAGLTWTDTVVMRDSTSDSNHRRLERIGDYRVTGDTTIAGEHALVIGAALRTTIRATTPVPGQPLPARADLGGSENATFYFAPATGRFLGRVRDGTIAGVITVGGAGGMQMEQRLAYTSRIDAVR